jgi:hypothetical protein
MHAEPLNRGHPWAEQISLYGRLSPLMEEKSFGGGKKPEPAKTH